MTVLVIVGYGAKNIAEEGSRIHTVKFTNNVTDALGFSAYVFEGIGLILTVYEITANKEKYKYIVVGVILSCASAFIFFGTFCAFAWGDELNTPLVTDKLPPNMIGWTIRLLFCVCLVFSQPLQLYPAHMIIEDYLYSTWPKTPKRMWSKNVTRTLLVGFTVVFTMMLGEKMDKFLSILGALCCTPIAFTFPAMFHLKVVANSPLEKAGDILIILLSAVILVLCTTLGFIGWNE